MAKLKLELEADDGYKTSSFIDNINMDSKDLRDLYNIIKKISIKERKWKTKLK